MLKLIGCLCVFAASSGMAYSCVLGLQRELRLMEQLQDLLTAVEGEITYSFCPLPELLEKLSGHMPKPYRDILLQGSYRMEENSEADIPTLWQSVCGQFRAQLKMPGEAFEVLLRMGEVFSYASLEASLQLLRLSRKKLACVIEGRQAAFSGRRKLYCCLCYTAGLSAIIILL